MLRIENLCVTYGQATALLGVSIDVATGELVAVIGPNGAGKTTLVNAIAGFLPIRDGAIFVAGKNVTNLQPRLLSERGVALIAEGRRLYDAARTEKRFVEVRGGHVDASSADGARFVSEISAFLQKRSMSLSPATSR